MWRLISPYLELLDVIEKSSGWFWDLVIRSLLEQEEEQVCVFYDTVHNKMCFFTKIWRYSKKVGGLSCFPKDISSFS